MASKEIDELLETYIKGSKKVDDVIDALLKGMDLPTGEAIEKPTVPVPEPELETTVTPTLVETEFGQHDDPNMRMALFSNIFWKPAHVPDHLIAVYKEGVYESPPIPDIFVPPKKAVETFSFCTAMGLKGVIVGPTGSGKTMMTEWYAAKTCRPFLRIDHNQELDKSLVFGQTHINVDEEGRQSTDFIPGVLPQSMLCPTIVVLDELTRAPADAVIQYQRLLDRREMFLPEVKGDPVTIKPVDGWMLCATDNTKGNGDGLDLYSASNVQDAAVLNRFDFMIDYDYLPQDQEKELIKRFYPAVSDTDAENLSKFSDLMHKGFLKREVTMAFSPRNLKAVTGLLSGGMNLKLALEVNFISRIAEAEISDVKECVKSVFG